MITMNNVAFRYRKDQIFKDLTLSIEKGKVYGLLGKNGAGKSTMLYLLTGLLTPQYGDIMYKGENVLKRKPSMLQDIFIMPEEFYLPKTSLKKYIAINSPFYPNFSHEQLTKNLDYFDLKQDINLETISLGQKKKVFMCFAFATNTSLLIMDEPTNGLDISGKSQFRKFLASNMDDEKIILISTHQVQDVNNLLEHILILDNGELILNRAVSYICERLCFVESHNNTVVKEALYAMPSPRGYSLILPNENKEDTLLNIETLFNALLTDREKILTYLQA